MTLLNTQQILETLPHRWPFAFVDKIVELEPGVRAVGIKGVTYNEWFFPGHLPGFPIMPGVIIVEACAQVGGLALMSDPEYKGKQMLFAGINNFRFRKPILPGDSMRIEWTITQKRGRIITAKATVTVEGEIAAEGELSVGITGKEW